MTSLSQDCVKLRKRNSKTQQLTLNQRNGILQRLLQYKKGGDKLQHGAINVVAADFQVSRITVSKIWHIAKRQYSAGQKFADVSSRKKKNCGRKRKDYSENLAKMKDIPKNCCGSIRSLSAALDIPKSTLFDIFKRDLQCSTDEDDEEFQEVSEDENNAASILDQGERLQATHTTHVSEGNSSSNNNTLIDAANIKTEMKMEPLQMGGDDSMDLDPNYDPSDFLTMHNRLGGGNHQQNDNQQDHLQQQQQQQQQQQTFSQYLPPPPSEENQNVVQDAQIVGGVGDQQTNMSQLPLIMDNNDNVGIDEDLAISESDEEDECGQKVTVKTEVFNENLNEDHHMNSAVNLMSNEMLSVQSNQQQQQQQQQQQLMQNAIPYVIPQVASKEEPNTPDDNDDGWLRF